MSQGEPEAPLLGRLVSEAFNEISLTFWVTSEALITGSKEVRGLSLVLVNMKKTPKDWIIMWGRAVNQEALELQGKKEVNFKKTDLSKI